MSQQTQKLALLKQYLTTAEKSIASARKAIADLEGVDFANESADQDQAAARPNLAKKAESLSIMDEGRIVEGVFDGQNMLGPDEKQYPVPANYASKSKLVEGDILKLTISPDGSFIFKQIGPVERAKAIGIVDQEDGDYVVNVDGKIYKVLLASVTYFKAEPADEVTIIIPKGQDSKWAAIENIIKKAADVEAAGEKNDSAEPDLEKALDLNEDISEDLSPAEAETDESSESNDEFKTPEELTKNTDRTKPVL